MRNTLAAGALDRVSDQRKDADWVAQGLEAGHIHLVWQGRFGVVGDRSAATRWADVRDLQGDYGPILLGVLNGDAHFVLDVSHMSQPEVEKALHEDAMMTGLREVAGSAAHRSRQRSGLRQWDHHVAQAQPILRGLRGRNRGA